MIYDPTSATAVPTRTAGRFDPEAAFQGKIKRVHTSIVYKFFMLIGALLMIALPLVYVGGIGAFGYWLYDFGRQNISLDGSSKPRRVVGAQRVLRRAPNGRYETIEVGGRAEADPGAGPVIVVIGGVIVIFFLIKPLLARPGKGIRARVLKPEDEPILFEYVRQLSRTIGAPMPRRIELDCEVNASASPAGGLFSLLTRRLTLRIGLPLVAGLNLRQLSGVLAHEFGHFSQGGGMLLSGIIRRTNLWFARVVYQRDTWDETLRQLSTRIDIRLAIFFIVIRLLVWLSRRVLWVLMHVGHLFVMFLSRQMEYDADRYGVRLIGAEAAEELERRIQVLVLAWEKTKQDLDNAMAERRLTDNLPLLIAANAVALPAKTREDFLAKMMKQRTGFFETHPALRDRIRSLQREKDEGIFFDERPAEELFRDFDDCCRTVSMEFYAAVLGARVSQNALIDGREFVGTQQAAEATMDASTNFFNHCFDVDRPPAIEPADLEAPANPKKTALELKHARERFAELAALGRESFKTLLASWELDLKAFIAAEAIQARLPYHVDEPRLRKPAEVEAARSQARLLLDEAEMIVLPVEDVLRTRLLAAIRLLHTPQLAERIPESGELLRQAGRLAAALAAYRAACGPIAELRRNHALLGFIMSKIKGSTKDKHVVDKVYAVARANARLASRISENMRNVPYPFAIGSGGEGTMGQYLMDVPPDPKDIPAVGQKCDDLLERLNRFFLRALGELGQMAERVEAAVGLPPLSLPN